MLGRPLDDTPAGQAVGSRGAKVAGFILWYLAALAAAFQVYSALVRPAYDRLADLAVYAGSVRLLADGGSLYDFAAAHNAAPFTYPPFAGLVLYPLALVDDGVARAGWTALS